MNIDTNGKILSSFVYYSFLSTAYDTITLIFFIRYCSNYCNFYYNIGFSLIALDSRCCLWLGFFFYLSIENGVLFAGGGLVVRENKERERGREEKKGKEKKKWERWLGREKKGLTTNYQGRVRTIINGNHEARFARPRDYLSSTLYSSSSPPSVSHIISSFSSHFSIMLWSSLRDIHLTYTLANYI